MDNKTTPFDWKFYMLVAHTMLIYFGIVYACFGGTKIINDIFISIFITNDFLRATKWILLEIGICVISVFHAIVIDVIMREKRKKA